MNRPLTSEEWVRLMDQEEAFGLILPSDSKQPRTVIILDDCKHLFRSHDLDEIIATWQQLDPFIY